ncbi:hypothetical protein [Amycolatopsis saalfeldensis]|uniref:PE family protein n=1 Tax=Amycolatopsis saalfeldensis TaxID=394193 RepID=A0A1H8YK21_9PSEU|nr:hypothetical protein [Amycolatopsis saalfeldensis]SEP52433.1 hypothetical protein SAMN04489732_12096 [Amycolatopsis saalfeldensis]
MTDPSGQGGFAAASLRIRQELDATAAQDATALAAGGRAGFTLDPPQANAMLTEVSSILDELTDIQSQTRTLTSLKPPADDNVSTGYNKKLTSNISLLFGAVTPWTTAAAFDAAGEQMQALIDYLTTLQEKLNKALGKVQATEHDNKGAVDQAVPKTGGYM